MERHGKAHPSEWNKLRCYSLPSMPSRLQHRSRGCMLRCQEGSFRQPNRWQFSCSTPAQWENERCFYILLCTHFQLHLASTGCISTQIIIMKRCHKYGQIWAAHWKQCTVSLRSLSAGLPLCKALLQAHGNLRQPMSVYVCLINFWTVTTQWKNRQSMAKHMRSKKKLLYNALQL